MLKQFVCMWTPVFFCQLLRTLAMLWPSEAHCIALTDWWHLAARQYGPLQWLYWRSQILIVTGKTLSLLTFVREMQGPASVFYETVFETTSWPSACTQVEGYYWCSVRKQAYPSSALCLLFFMVIRPLLLKDCAIWFRATTLDCQRTCERYLSD